jgi:hypothetical protein
LFSGQGQNGLAKLAAVCRRGWRCRVVNQQQLDPAGLTGDDCDGGFRYFQHLGHQLDQHAVGGALHRRRLELDLEGLPVGTDDQVAGGFGLDRHLEADAVGGFGEVHGAGRVLRRRLGPGPPL